MGEGKAEIGSTSQRAVWPATIASASLVAQLVAGKATRDALFLSHFDLALLPAAMIGAASLSAVSVILISHVLTRSGPVRVVPATFAASALLFLVEWWISLKSEHATAIAVYAHTAIFGTAIGSAFWSLVNERFDPHEAKQLVGRITSGGTIGGVLGGLLVWRASSHLSIPMMLALLAAMSVAGLWGSIRMGSGDRPRPKAPAIVVRGGIGVLAETPYLRDLAGLVAASAIIQALLDWLLSAHATHRYSEPARLLEFFAFYNTIVGVLSFAVQTGLTRTLLEKYGLGGTIKIQPISVAASIVVLLAMAVFWPYVVVLRVIEGVTRGSLYRSAYELFYTPLPNLKKRATKTLIDVGVDRIGTAFGSVILFGIAHLASLEHQTRAVLLAVLGLSGAAWYIATRLQDGYVSALAASLKSGAGALADDDEVLSTKKTLTETTALLDRNKLLARIEQFQRHKDLRDAKSQPGRLAITAPPVSERAPLSVTSDLVAAFDPTDKIVLRSAGLRSRDAATIKKALLAPLTPNLAPLAVPLLANDLVVRDAVRSLRNIAPSITGMLLDHLLDPSVDPRVRRRLPRILKASGSQRAATGLLFALSDPELDVRVQVGVALRHLAEDRSIKLDRDTVLEMAMYELTEGRASWSIAEPPSHDGVRRSDPSVMPSEVPQEDEAPPSPRSELEADDLRRGLAHVFTVLGLALEREPLSIAYRALKSEDPNLRGTAFEYLEVVLPPRLRDVILPLLGDVKPPPRSRERGSTELAAELLRSHAGALRSSSS